jgi:hypothetical protein
MHMPSIKLSPTLPLGGDHEALALLALDQRRDRCCSLPFLEQEACERCQHPGG